MDIAARLRFANRAIHSAVRQGYLYGTSIGLDRPLVNILLDIKAALDPGNQVLYSWNASQLQPCRPYSRDGGTTIMQSSASPGYGRSWKYISTAVSTVSAEYCQDLQKASSGYLVYSSPTATFTNTRPMGGIAALWLSNLALKGSVALVLRELRTVTQIVLTRNQLTGALPACWGVPIVWSYFNVSAGFDACALLDLGQNRINGSFSPQLAAISPTGQMALSVYDNQIAGQVPSAFGAFSWLALAYNPLLVGSLPASVNASKLSAWSAYNNAFYPWLQANMGLSYGLAPTYSTVRACVMDTAARLCLC